MQMMWYIEARATAFNDHFVVEQTHSKGQMGERVFVSRKTVS